MRLLSAVDVALGLLAFSVVGLTVALVFRKSCGGWHWARCGCAARCGYAAHFETAEDITARRDALKELDLE